MRGSSGTIVLFHSLVKLPETPMTPRLFDERVGYFTDVARTTTAATSTRPSSATFITRYRLEKKDPDAPLSGPGEADRLLRRSGHADEVRAVDQEGASKTGSPAFEAAGFSNAIVAKDAPSRRRGSGLGSGGRALLGDALAAVDRPRTRRGRTCRDPRSGEILEADIQLYHNVQNLATMWYFTQVGPLDPRAQKLPLPDDLMGRLIEFVVGARSRPHARASATT